MKLYRDTIYALIETAKSFPFEAKLIKNYTDIEKVIEQASEIEGWYMENYDVGKTVDAEKGAYESTYEFKDSEGKSYFMHIDWENNASIPMLDNLKGDDLVELSLK